MMRKSFIYAMVCVAGILFFSSCLVTQANLQYREACKDGGYDVVIVPGVPYQDTGYGSVMEMRIRWAQYLFNTGVARNIIFSGAAVYTPYIEGRVMCIKARKLGLPAAHLFSEEEAEHSTENLYYGYNLARKLGFKRVALASDPFQTFLLSEVNERFGLYEVGFLPMPVSFLRAVDKTHIDIDPEPARVKEFKPLPERESAGERFRGTLGRNVRLHQRTTEKQEMP